MILAYKEWLRLAKIGWQENSHLIKTGIFALALTGVLLLFASRIFNSINRGLETKRRTEKLAQEVKELERKNEELKYEKELYTSQSEIEAQYRALENKKREGEKVYIISLESEKNKSNEENIDNANSQQAKADRLANARKWFEKVF